MPSDHLRRRQVCLHSQGTEVEAAASSKHQGSRNDLSSMFSGHRCQVEVVRGRSAGLFSFLSFTTSLIICLFRFSVLAAPSARTIFSSWSRLVWIYLVSWCLQGPRLVPGFSFGLP